MKNFGLILAGAATIAFGTAAAQAANFDIQIIYWQNSDTPPADPGADNIAHFQLDDSVFQSTDHSFKIQASGTGMAGYSGDLRIDFYDAEAGGGISLIPNAGGVEDYNNMVQAGALTVEDAQILYTGTVDAPHLKVGMFDMLDVSWMPRPENGHYRITISALDDAAVPEPASWALMLGGFGLVGASLRRRSLTFA